MSEYVPVTKEKRLIIGRALRQRWQINNAAGTPQSMQGKAIEIVVRRDADGPVVLSKSTAGGGIALYNTLRSPVQNDGIEVTWARADTIAGTTPTVQPDHYFYTLSTVDPGDETPLAYGPFVVSLLATR